MLGKILGCILRHSLLTFSISVLYIGNAIADQSESDHYLRIGIGLAKNSDTRFYDQNCNAMNPAALFGCANGPDSRPIGAYGDFESSKIADVAWGKYHNKWFRSEIAASWRGATNFNGQANFSHVPLNQQPVEGSVRSTGIWMNGFIDLATLMGNSRSRIQPFVGAGIGIAHNKVSEMTYRFPTLGANDITVTPSGKNTSMAWSLNTGISIKLSHGKSLDFTYRYSNLGKIQTDSGNILVVRGTNRITIPIEKTIANLTSNAFIVGLRISI